MGEQNSNVHDNLITKGFHIIQLSQEDEMKKIQEGYLSVPGEARQRQQESNQVHKEKQPQFYYSLHLFHLTPSFS